MDRLTDPRWLAMAEISWCAAGERCRYHADPARREHCRSCPVLRIYNKLALYEDTGLEPREVDPSHRRPRLATVRRHKI